MEFLTNILNVIRAFFYRIRKFILTILLIGLPIFIYFGFIREDPIFEPEYDIEMGRQSVYSIQQDSIENPLLSEADYPEAYEYMRNMVSEITKSPDVQYANLFKYDSVQIIHRDDILNAFCTPGGYVYVYTGLIHYLDHPDHLAGVLGHEIAHAENRHSAVRLQKEYGRERMLDLLLVGGAGLSGYIQAKILKDMLTLNYSRDQEAQADEYSVLYLDDTSYACNGAAGFFEKLIEAGEDVPIPEWLSDHPDSGRRVRDINAKAKSMGCDITLRGDAGWEAFKALLPQPEKEGEEDMENPDAEAGDETDVVAGEEAEAEAVED